MATETRVPLIGAVMMTLLLGGLTGCRDNKKKATKVIKDAVEACQNSDATFHKVSLMNGEDEKQVLARTCNEKIGKIKLVDSTSARAKIGPYLWRATLNDATGVWTIQSVKWEHLDQARRRLSGEEPGKNVLKHAKKKLRQAQKQYPKSSWIRLERLKTLLRLRLLERQTDASGLKLGKPVQKHLKQTLAWADEKDHAETRARAQLQIVDYYQGFADQIDDALGAMGSQDVHLKRSAELAEERGNKKEAEEYRNELKKLKKKRPKRRKRYKSLLDKTTNAVCKRLAEFDGPIEGADDLNAKVSNAKNATNCSEKPSSKDD